MTTNVNFDLTLYRLKERAEECGYGIADQFCLNCDAQLTIADVEQGECTQCHSAIDCNDESVDEDLWSDD